MQKKTKQKNNSKTPWGNFHDCHICKAMEQGRGATEEDLTKIFAKAEALQNKSSQNS